MRWDWYFQEEEKKRKEEEGDDSDGNKEEIEPRVLKDRVKKANLPKGATPAALKEYEASLLLNLTKPSNLKQIKMNLSPEERAAVKDLKLL